MSNITEPTWPEYQKPTPAQFRAWYALQTEAGQLEIAEKVLRWADEAQTCFEQNHQAAVEQLHYAHQRIVDQNNRILRHETETDPRGHDDNGECCRRAKTTEAGA